MELLGAFVLEMDYIIGPKVKAEWLFSDIIKNKASHSALIKLFTLASLEDEVPRIITFSNAKMILSRALKSKDYLAAIFVDKKTDEDNALNLWKRLRIVIGKSKNERKLITNLDNLINKIEPAGS